MAGGGVKNTDQELVEAVWKDGQAHGPSDLKGSGGVDWSAKTPDRVTLPVKQYAITGIDYVNNLGATYSGTANMLNISGNLLESQGSLNLEVWLIEQSGNGGCAVVNTSNTYGAVKVNGVTIHREDQFYLNASAGGYDTQNLGEIPLDPLMHTGGSVDVECGVELDTNDAYGSTDADVEARLVDDNGNSRSMGVLLD